VLFYSDTPGAGNHVRYNLTLPTDPPAADPLSPGKSYAFELSGADWLGMALCATQSYPELVSTCPPDSDSNILDPRVSPRHVGEAYLELQFYPPGWVPWPTWAVAVGASSCDPTKWCVAMNIFSLALNALNGRTLNSTCLSRVGEEYLNFAFLTKNGVAQAPANPLDATLDTYTPDPAQDLFMSSGDQLQVAMTDTPDGVRASINDLTSGQTGSMTASPANGFAQIAFQPEGTSCTALPYAFHPMYSTSTPQTRVTWAAHSYNVAFDSEIGHFQFCTGPTPIPATPFGLTDSGQPTTCPTTDTEGQGATAAPPDPDDVFCFPASEALTYKVPGCTYTNLGFDGVSYQPVWPDGNTSLHPTPIQVSSPETGSNYDVQFPKVAFETDTPAFEPLCDVVSGKDCTIVPRDEHGTAANFYPFFTTTDTARGCMFQFGNNIPNQITNFGGDAQYGTLLAQNYTTGDGAAPFIQDYRNILGGNPCPQG
jgi:hypothetical protein